MESTPVTMVTVSSDLFGDLPVQLILLRLLPLQVGISALPADSSNAVDPEEDTQGLLRTPGSSVPGKTRQLTFLVQSSLIERLWVLLAKCQSLAQYQSGILEATANPTQRDLGRLSLAGGPLLPGALPLHSAACQPSGDGVQPVLTAGPHHLKVLIYQSAVEKTAPPSPPGEGDHQIPQELSVWMHCGVPEDPRARGLL
ncbi:unnamed protein product [Arctogadus glacialis]